MWDKSWPWLAHQIHPAFPERATHTHYIYILGDAGWIWWAHWGHNLSQVHLFTLKGCGPCHSNTGSNSHRVASYPTNLQTTKSHQLNITKITLSTYRWTNKEPFPVWLQFHFLRGTVVVKSEGLWLPGWTNQGTSLNNWTKLQTKTQVSSSSVSCMIPFIPTPNLCKKDVSDITK